ncbi:hypothetical protein D3C85_1257190 [compost metagenome]
MFECFFDGVAKASVIAIVRVCYKPTMLGIPTDPNLALRRLGFADVDQFTHRHPQNVRIVALQMVHQKGLL